MILLAASLWFVHPAPLDMPRAEAYLVRGEKNGTWLEDRYDTLDLWTSQAVLGRWEDDDGRRFTLARLDTVPPAFAEARATRMAYAAARVAFDRRDKSLADLRAQCLDKLSPVAVAKDPEKPRQEIRGLDEVLYHQGTNTAAIVCTFLPEDSSVWYLAAWELLAGDDFAYSRERFEEDFLARWREVRRTEVRSEVGRVPERPRKARAAGAVKGRARERELLRADARHSVTNFTNWHVTEAVEFSILDDLPAGAPFVAALTNELPVLRRKYAARFPSPVDGTNVLCVARIFKDRDEYLDAVGEEMAWTAAYWSPSRRELVAYLPEDGTAKLMRTIRHEAFHQYLSYACAMITPAPWLNEGYAEYFEDEDSLDWDLGGRQVDYAQMAEMIPSLLAMDYERFYAGSELERRLKYRTAWSLVVFLEKGADAVRFAPFKNLTRDYVRALLDTHDMRKATEKAFGSRDNLDLFIAEWEKFWRNM